MIDQLVEMMPEHSGPDMSQDRGMPQYDYISFMEKMLNNRRQDEVPEGVLQERTNVGASPRKEIKA